MPGNDRTSVLRNQIGELLEQASEKALEIKRLNDKKSPAGDWSLTYVSADYLHCTIGEALEALEDV
jgi:hypothetical protein